MQDSFNTATDDSIVEQIKSAIDAQGEAIADWRSKTEGRVEQLAKAFDQVLIAAQRPTGFALGTASTAEAKAFGGWLRSGREAPELKALHSGSGPDGGLLLPSGLDDQLQRALAARSPIRQLARVVRIDTNELRVPYMKNGPAAVWVGERQSRPETAAPGFAVLTVPANEIYASPAISQNLLDDASFNMETFLVEALAESFDASESAAFLTGDGIERPRGLFTAPTAATADASRPYGVFQHILSGADGALHTDKLDAFIKTTHALAPQYRARAAWLMPSEVLEALRKLKDLSDRPLWEPSNQAGEPDRLLGFPVHVDDRCPGLATGSLSVAFGDFSRAYVVADRKAAVLRDPFTAKPYVMFYTTRRVGGGFGPDTNAVKFLKFSAS